LIVNAAAHTAVDQAESEPALTHTINAEAPRVLTEEAQKLNIPLIHYSTDYVFDGNKTRPYSEEDDTNPLNVYGHTKLAAEQAIQEAHDQYLIFRTSWVYSLKGKNFLTTMLRVFEQREEIRVVDDQFGTPTSAAALAEATRRILDQLRSKEEGENRWGLYHLTAKGQTSWYGFAQEIKKRAKEKKELSVRLRVKEIVPIPTSDYPTPARRPRNSRLDTSKVIQGFQIELSSWQNGLL
jgi:dTDP-4-dehydrorhamnose reductase